MTSDEQKQAVEANNTVNTGANTTVNAANNTTAPGTTAAQAGQKPTWDIATEIPEVYTANNNEELIRQIEERMQKDKPMSDEDVKKLERKQKAEGIISSVADAARSIANLVGTHNYAPNMFDATKSMSAKAKARFDKEKAERDAKDAQYLNYAMYLAKLKGDSQDRAFNRWLTGQQLARQDKNRAEDVQFRKDEFDAKKDQWQQTFDREGTWHDESEKKWERQFNESVRQFNISSANERARIGLEAKRLAHAMDEGNVTFNLGKDKGNITLTKQQLNYETLSYIYHTLDEEVRESVPQKPIYEKDDLTGEQKLIGYEDPTQESMLIAIGAYVGSSPQTQEAIRQVATGKPSKPGQEYKGTIPGISK